MLFRIKFGGQLNTNVESEQLSPSNLCIISCLQSKTPWIHFTLASMFLEISLYFFRHYFIPLLSYVTLIENIIYSKLVTLQSLVFLFYPSLLYFISHFKSKFLQH